MIRRSSSLVTISLDSLLDGLEYSGKGLCNDGLNPEMEGPLAGNPDGKPKRRNSWSFNETGNNSNPGRPEMFFQRVFLDLPLQSPNVLELPEERARTKCCVSGCTNMCSASQEWILSILDFFKQKLVFVRTKLQSECDRSYLQTYFLYASRCGVTPFHFDQNNKQVEWLKKAPYYVVNTLAITDICVAIKEWLSEVVRSEAAGTSDIGEYMRNANDVTKMMLRVSFIISMRRHKKKYDKAIQAIVSSSFFKDLHKVQTYITSVGICCTSFAIVVISTHYSLQQGFNTFLIGNAHYMQKFFGIEESYGLQETKEKELNAVSVLLGLFGWAANFAGNLVSQIARDGILFAAITLGKTSQAFKYKQGTVAEANPQQTLRRFAELKTISKRINSAFKVILRIFLMANIFMLTLFVDEYFDPDIGKLIKMLKLINVVFVAMAFYYSNEAAKKGEKFVDWMMSKENRETLGLTQVDIIAEALSRASTGLGRGALYINDALLIGFAGVVAAYFFGIVETRPKLDTNLNMNGTAVRMLFGNNTFFCYEG